MPLTRWAEDFSFPEFMDLNQSSLINKGIRKPGVYIIRSADATNFIYPNGESPIYYIGRAGDLENRLKQHIQFHGQALTEQNFHYFYPRYAYAAKFGMKFTYITCENELDSKRLEGNVLKAFALRFHCVPVANCSIPWKYMI